MKMRKLASDENVPMDLLLLADPSPAIIESYLDRGECYVVEVGKEIVGVFVLLATRPHTVELVNIAVAETHQGKGIGKALVLGAIQIAQKKGFKTIEVGTGNSSIGQLALYQKCGFQIIGIDKGFFVKHYQEEIIENGIHCRDMVRLSQDINQ